MKTDMSGTWAYLPEEKYLNLGVDCPGCTYPERRVRFDAHGPIFSCLKCAYISRTKNK